MPPNRHSAPEPLIPSLPGKRAAVVGLGVSNLPLVRFLLQRGVAVTGMDKRTTSELGERYDLLIRLTAQSGTGFAGRLELRLGPDYLGELPGYQLIFLTPGIRKDLPEIEAARSRGAVFSSEIALAMEVSQAPVLAVTGSAGKTTTTTLLGQILEADGRRVHVGGNIGHPLIEEAGSFKPSDLVVLELSSFQLQMLGQSPHIGAVTNISPNHLDIHASMEEYVEAKKNIFRFQGPSDWAVLNADNPATAAMAAECPGRVALFSRTREVDFGAFLRRDQIIFRGPAPGSGFGPRDGGAGAGGSAAVERVLATTGGIKLPGQHNLENILCAAAVASLAGARPEAIARTVTAFGGVEHRLELVAEVGGVRYFNDSIATSPDRTTAALRTIHDPIHLILGGYDKKIPFDELALEIVLSPHVRTVLLIGQAGDKIGGLIERATGMRPGGGPQVVHCGALPEAVAEAARRAHPGEVVLLSPACASFDQYRSFEQRGRHFEELVSGLGSGLL